MRGVTRQLSFDDLPEEKLAAIVENESCSEDNFMKDSDDPLQLMLTVDTGEKWWETTAIEGLGVDNFVHCLIQTRLFFGILKKFLDPILQPQCVETTQLDKVGRAILNKLEEEDRSRNPFHILKLRKVDLNRSTLKSSNGTSSRYEATFLFPGDDQKSLLPRADVNTGCLHVVFAKLGELGNYGEKNPATSNDKIDLSGASYELGVNGDMQTDTGKLSFAKLMIMSVMVDAKYLFLCMTKEKQHTYYKECHPNRNQGAFQAAAFAKKFAEKFLLRHSDEPKNSDDPYPKIRKSVNSGKHYFKFTSTVLKPSFRKTSEDDTVAIQDEEDRKRARAEMKRTPGKIYRSFPLYYHGIMGGCLISPQQRKGVGFGDIIQFNFRTICFTDPRKKVFNVFHNINSHPSLILRSMYLCETNGRSDQSSVDAHVQELAMKRMKSNEDVSSSSKRALTDRVDDDDAGGKRPRLLYNDISDDEDTFSLV